MEEVGVWEWFWLLLIFSLPIINIIALIIFALGNGKPSIVNFSRAGLIWAGILFCIGLLIGLSGI